MAPAAAVTLSAAAPLPAPAPVVEVDRVARKRARKAKTITPTEANFSPTLLKQLAAEKEAEERVRRRLEEMRQAVRAGTMQPARLLSAINDHGI